MDPEKVQAMEPAAPAPLQPQPPLLHTRDEDQPPTREEKVDESTGTPKAQQQSKARPERQASFKDYIRIFTYARKWDFLLMAIAIVSAIGAGITLPLMNVVFGQLVGNFADFDPSKAGPGAAAMIRDFEKSLDKLSLYIFALFIGRFFLGYFNKFCFRMISIRMSAAIRAHYLQCLFSQTVHVLDSMPSGAAAGTITTTANTLQSGIGEKLGTYFEFNATIISALIIAFTRNWRLTLVTSTMIIFILIVISILLPFIIKLQGLLTKAETKAGSVANEAFSSIKMIAACGAESRMAKRYAEWVRKAQKHGQTMAPFMAVQFGLVFFGMYAAFALAFWYGTKLFVEGYLDNVGEIVIVLMSVMLMVISLERVSSPLIQASKAMVAAAEFFAIIDAPPPSPGTLQEPDVSATDDIVFSDVDFAYPSRPHVKVLDGLDIHIEAGKVTAIVGPSGSGKSTIVGLIERWYSLKNGQYVIAKTVEKDKEKEAEEKKRKKEEKKKKKGKKNSKGQDSSETKSEETVNPAGPLIVEDEETPVELKGSITLSGHSIDEVDIRWWRSQIGLVQQEPFLFNDTIFNNVAYGLVGSENENASDERKKELVEEACKEAFADEFIDRLPDGYQTMVGESGTKLSGGQRQRIAIARSIAKQPKILILDEATSAIDVRGERIVQAALERVSRNRTTITIAHRLSTIKSADKIIVMQKGRCVESGTHEGLLKNEAGVYYGLVHAQQLSLGDDSSDDELQEENIGDILAREKSAAVSERENQAIIEGWTNKGLFGSFGKLLLEQKTKIPSYLIAVVGAMGAATASPIQAYLFARLIKVFTLRGEELMHESRFWALMWVVLAAGVGFSYFVMGLVANYLQHFICATYRQQYFVSILNQRTLFFDQEDHSAGTLTSRVGGDPKQLEELLGINMTMVLTAIFQIIGSLIISFIYGWKLALVALCVTVPMGLGSGYWRVKYELEFDQMNAAVFAESSKWAAESIGAFRTVTALTLEDFISTRYNVLLAGHLSTALRSARFKTLVFALADSISLACQALIFWYGGHLVAKGEYDIFNFFVCYMAVIQGAEAAGQGLSFGPNAAQATGAANRILSIRESGEKEVLSGETIRETEGGIRIDLEDVHFKYPTRNVSIFKGLNITIEKGQYAALVGASGSGKTSIVSLLERFYEPRRGRILFNGTDVAGIDLHEYRRLISLVAQEATLFQGSIRDNVLLGVEEGSVTEARLHQACRDASIHDFVVSLPEGYDTDIGSKGVSLSGGQKQRIAIARALVRDPRVLLLDEATSSLDSDTEKLIQATFERVAKGRTTVAVAHRLSTIQRADVIYVLGEGRVLEKGSHAELLRQRGVYWNMCQSQALDR
ncbi:uncharacterized protein E0L32_009643 [Thyridium curvatum]|uniref:Uncharacterized protein n=1 Tax=Thyridium curvatum TaxID=1093900 RepID=A0A507AVG9_9PEZI|nr:uncharacterized protein E0L32_009643 [Thyridium curvatum]TPX08939.1 hypothetical protein E0L32_009643 [Thyridium curvatum]